MPPRRSNGTQATQASSRRRRAEEEQEQEDSEADRDYASGEEGDTQLPSGMTEAQIKTKAALLVRLALFLEYKRRPLPRQVIVKEVMGDNPPAYEAVFEQAQESLRSTFGMQLVELHSKSQGQGEALANRAGGKGKGKGRVVQEDDVDGGEGPLRAKKVKASGPKTYILRSTLPGPLVEAMAQPRPLPLLDTDGDDGGDGPPDSGALIPWEKADGTASGHVAFLGIRTLILSLIMCMGRVITDDHLHALLRRLNLHRETLLPHVNPTNPSPPMALDRYLDLLARQNYLVKTKITSQAAGAGEERWSFEWRWGTREVEFSEKDAASFIEKFMEDEEEQASDSEDEGDDRETRRERRNREADKEKAKRKLREDIVKAAGGPLTG